MLLRIPDPFLGLGMSLKPCLNPRLMYVIWEWNCFSFFTKVLGYEVDVVNSVQFSNHTGMSNRICLSCDLSSVCANLESPSCLYSLCSTSESPQLSIRAAVLTYIAIQHIPRLPNLLVHQHGSNLLYASLCIFKKLWHHMKKHSMQTQAFIMSRVGHWLQFVIWLKFDPLPNH